jgi:hypothetical protein
MDGRGSDLFELIVDGEHVVPENLTNNGSERLQWGNFVTVRYWHKVSSSQSTTKQAFSIGGMYHATVRLSLEPDRHFLGLTGLGRFSENGIGKHAGMSGSKFFARINGSGVDFFINAIICQNNQTGTFGFGLSRKWPRTAAIIIKLMLQEC